MAKICILLSSLLSAAMGRTSADLNAKYPYATAYKVRPDVLTMARFAANGQVCEMTLEKREKTDTGIVFDVSFSEKEVQTLIDDLVPENQRGRNLTRTLNETIDGAFTTTEYTYENAVVRVYGLVRPVDVTGKRVITITWPKRPCGEVEVTAR